jgi:non-specific serine/threonine protein kinase
MGGETTWRVPSLSVPDPLNLPPLDRFMEYEAVQLFMERAVARAPQFAVTSSKTPAVAQVCHRLDGIPLAIELAAARVNVLAVEQIATRLDDRFRLLIGGSRTTLPRQQTLQAAMNWSYDLLSEKERTLLRRLSVFAGGWTLEAAEAICFGDGTEVIEILDLMTQLVNKSLVVVEMQDKEARYRMLESVRQYGRERLREVGGAEDIHRRHRDWFLKLAETAEVECLGRQQSMWYDRLVVEHDNFRAALEWSLGDADEGAVLRLAAALYPLWFVRGHFAEGRRWLERALSPSSTAPTLTRAKALYAAGWLAQVQLDDNRAVELAEANLALRQQHGEKQGIARALILLGAAAQDRGEYGRARLLLEQGLSLSQELGDTVAMAIALNNLGQVARRQGDYAAARSSYGEALALRRGLGDEGGIAVQLDNLGRVAWHDGNYEHAYALFAEALGIRWKLGFKLGIATNLTGLAAVAEARAQPARAARLLGAAEALLGTLGASLYRTDRVDYDRTVARVRAALGEEAFLAARTDGRVLTVEQAIAYALRTDP